ncbi:hypothetical protein HHL28_00065 [Aerophototrophica crusticola]|uniref:Uncharacterized protein n=1 Tax=Aerophototrophica crusticola TaxID=1709002 RepID=A0A858R2V8_9PROT|nr:hypothetical protein HHL28_00065 [Rhodospirillaceae bacterium B3]
MTLDQILTEQGLLDRTVREVVAMTKAPAPVQANDGFKSGAELSDYLLQDGGEFIDVDALGKAAREAFGE